MSDEPQVSGGAAVNAVPEPKEGDVYHHPNGHRVVVDLVREGQVYGWSIPPGAEVVFVGFHTRRWPINVFKTGLVEQGWNLTPTTLDEEVAE